MDAQEKLAVSVDEAVRLSGLSRSFLYLAIARRELRSVKVRKRRLILMPDLRDWLASLRVDPAGGGGL